FGLRFSDPPTCQPEPTNPNPTQIATPSLVYKIREIGEAKAAAVAADTATTARHLEEEKRKGIEEVIDHTIKSPHTVIKLLSSIADLFVFIRVSDYYVVGFRCFGRTYYFDDMRSEFLFGTPLGFTSHYIKGLGGLERATTNHGEFVEVVKDLIAHFRYDVKIRPILEQNDEGDSESEEIVLGKFDERREKSRARSIRRFKASQGGKQDKTPTTVQEVMTTKTVKWRKPVIRIVVVMAKAARTTIVARRVHRSQMSENAKVDYVNGVRELVPHSSRSRRMRALERKSVMHPLRYTMSDFITTWITNWSSASETANLHVQRPVRYVTRNENDVIEKACMGLDENGKQFFLRTIKFNIRLCAFLVQLKCKRKD
ncbi:hypothetical protein Tco_1141862, partial [Tanacetum coccineum]